ncbi:hypothetical protein [Paenibacillus turpanensis]|uniref:hypothetical protein n=1 Tax=Paenibacillus turpanensis TaxID=2689078 RepID=UPI00140ACB70|nr:hypothetical protein [Paenibacillus turpanensis]
MEWIGGQDSILNNDSPYTSCKEIFQAVCDEIGTYYTTKGFKYAKSRPSITYKDKEITLQIAFWSSGYNTPGDYVNVEIIPAFFSTKIARVKKTAQPRSKRGYLFGHPAIFLHDLPGREPGTVRIRQIFGDEMERYEEGKSEKLNHSCNVYGITHEKFENIIHFIDNHIISYIDVLKDHEKLLAFIEGSNKERSYYLNNPELLEYIEIAFPSRKGQLIEVLQKKIESGL